MSVAFSPETLRREADDADADQGVSSDFLRACADTWEQQLVEALRAPSAREWQPMADAAEMLWVVLANVSGGDWTTQTPEWQEAAARWRDNYFATMKLPPSPVGGPQ